MPLTFQVAIFIFEACQRRSFGILLYDAEFMRRGRAIEKELLLARVARERGRALELRARLVEAAELHEEVAAHGGQEMVVLESRLGGERIDERHPLRRSEDHGDPHRTPPPHDAPRRRRREP